MKVYDELPYEVWAVSRTYNENEIVIEVLARTALLAHAEQVFREMPLNSSRALVRRRLDESPTLLAVAGSAKGILFASDAAEVVRIVGEVGGP